MEPVRVSALGSPLPRTRQAECYCQGLVLPPQTTFPRTEKPLPGVAGWVAWIVSPRELKLFGLFVALIIPSTAQWRVAHRAFEDLILDNVSCAAAVTSTELECCGELGGVR